MQSALTRKHSVRARYGGSTVINVGGERGADHGTEAVRGEGRVGLGPEDEERGWCPIRPPASSPASRPRLPHGSPPAAPSRPQQSPAASAVSSWSLCSAALGPRPLSVGPLDHRGRTIPPPPHNCSLKHGCRVTIECPEPDIVQSSCLLLLWKWS